MWCPFLQQTSALEGMTWHRAQGVRRWDSQKSTMRGSEAVSAAAKPEQGLPLSGSAGFADAAPVQLAWAS